MGGQTLKGSPEPIAALNKVRILEYSSSFADREPLVDVRTFCPVVKLSEHLCPYLRKSAAEMLNAAQASLPPNHRLIIHTCLRTLAMQQHGWDNYFKKKREEHPEWPLSTLRRTVNKYYAPYDQPAPPGHCTGGAVDIGVLGPGDVTLDVLGPTKGWDAAYTWSEKIGEDARKNRMMMVNAMLDAGFSNCRDEYWHYSYGDSAWAVRVGKKECPYGWTHPDAYIDLCNPSSALTTETRTNRDQEGRPVRVEAHVNVGKLDNSAQPTIQFRLNWSHSVPAVIDILVDNASNNAELFKELFIGDGKNNWTPVDADNIDLHGGKVRLRLLPVQDRVYISNSDANRDKQAVGTAS